MSKMKNKKKQQYGKYSSKKIKYFENSKKTILNKAVF